MPSSPALDIDLLVQRCEPEENVHDLSEIVSAMLALPDGDLMETALPDATVPLDASELSDITLPDATAQPDASEMPDAPASPLATVQHEAVSFLDATATIELPDAMPPSPPSALMSTLSPMKSAAAQAFKALDSTLSTEARMLYRKSHEDNANLNDPVYIAYKSLKDQVDIDEAQRLQNIRDVCRSTGSSKLAQQELFRIPKANPRKPRRAENPLPLDLCSTEAIQLMSQKLEGKEREEREKKERKDKREASKLAKRLLAEKKAEKAAVSVKRKKAPRTKTAKKESESSKDVPGPSTSKAPSPAPTDRQKRVRKQPKSIQEYITFGSDSSSSSED